MISGTADGHGKKPRPISILIPAYRAADKLLVCLKSLAKHAPTDCRVHVLDDATPDDSVRKTCEAVQSHFPQLSYHQSEVNRGFVASCNWGFRRLREAGADLLLLNSDTEVTAGFLQEMQAVLYLHERHAVVTPRSNNATIFSVPWAGGILPPAESYEVWQQIRSLLSRYQVMPTCVGFCMLVKHEILERFGLFDESYGSGYNEENDFVCRINRYGYSAVAANWAYVFHYESSSFGARKKKLEADNRKLLLSRYPEYERKVADYVRFNVDPVEGFASSFVPHRPRILFDLFHLPALHSGTSEFALNLLREIGRLVEDDYDLYVGINQAREFFAHELTGYRIYEDLPNAQMTFDLVFMPCQLFTWDEFRRMARLAPRVAYTLLDIIAVRCDYLGAASRQILFRKTAELSDCVFAISEFSYSDFAAYYNSEITMNVIHLGTNFGRTTGEFRTGEYILVMGNDYVHKGVADAVSQLNGKWPVVVMGGKSQTKPQSENVRRLGSGVLSRQDMRELLVNARIMVYPSHYEGFGLPVVDALALGKPVIVLDNEVTRELAQITSDRNLHRIESLNQLQDSVLQIFEHETTAPKAPLRTWRAVAEEYVIAFREILARDVDVAKLRARWDTLRTFDSVCPSDALPRSSGPSSVRAPGRVFHRVAVLRRLLRSLWNGTSGHRLAPWRSPYLREKIETHTGVKMQSTGFLDFSGVMWRGRAELWRALKSKGRTER
jgi:GT2 family glycosyltransferase